MSEEEAIEIILDNKKEYERIIKELEDVTDTNGNKPNETIQDCQKFVQAIETILDLYKQEKEKNKELEKEMELNKEAIYLANNTICNYDIGYQDGLNKKMTVTEIVAEQRKFMILGQKINQLENANYELHKKIDEGNKKVVEDYISKEKIRAKIKQIEDAIEPWGNEDLCYQFRIEDKAKIEVLNELLEEN